MMDGWMDGALPTLRMEMDLINKVATQALPLPRQSISAVPATVEAGPVFN